MKSYILTLFLAHLTISCMENEHQPLLSGRQQSVDSVANLDSNPNEYLSAAYDILEHHEDDIHLPESIMPSRYYGPRVDLRAGTIQWSHAQIIGALKRIHKGNYVVRDLSLCNNKLCVLPPELFKLIALKSLDLACNTLQDIPFELCQNLTNLEYLNVSNNNIEELPGMLCLKKLESLNLGHTQFSDLKALREFILQSTTLRDVFINSTQIVLDDVKELRKEFKDKAGLTIY